MTDLRVASDRNTVVGGVQEFIIPFLNGNDRKVRGVTCLDLNGLIERAMPAASMIHDNGGDRLRLDA